MTTPPLRTPEEAAREAQCPNRRAGTCDLLNARLGWRHGLPLTHCDKCWASGPESDESIALREKLFQVSISAVKAKWRQAGDGILKVLFRDHFTPEEAAAVRAEQDFPMASTREERWSKVRHTWDAALSFAKSMKSRGFTGKRVPLHIRGIRHSSCFGSTADGEPVGEVCPALRASSDGIHHWCGECGCGDARLAWLDDEEYPKLDYPHLECPRAMPGFSNGPSPT